MIDEVRHTSRFLWPEVTGHDHGLLQLTWTACLLPGDFKLAGAALVAERQPCGLFESVWCFTVSIAQEGVAETAAVAEAPEALAGISMELLEVKRAIEDRMRAAMPLLVAARALEEFRDAGNIQGVAIGLGEGDSSSAEPGLPALTVYVAEPASVEQVRAVVVDSMGVQAAASESIPMNVVVTGLIDAQPHRFRIRPAPGGVSVAHFRVTAGTIGCLARGRTPPHVTRGS